ncbi:C39 family peptidase [Actinacidiphila glaucinigra]|uniref:C39 family peptidase n=1 Tax=Actinacidiphila glaucinigra TaxID=235986 RepID=UPI003D914C39
MCRQLIPLEEWDAHGGWTLGDRLEWSNRACGMAALRMILLAYTGQAPTVTELLHLAVKHEVMTARGAIHAGIADMAAELGVPGRAEPVDAADLVGRLNDAPLIISVTEQLPTDGRTGGHLIVARGHDVGSTADDPVILFRDPSSWGQHNDRAPLSRLTSSYMGRAITFPTLTGRGQA